MARAAAAYTCRKVADLAKVADLSRANRLFLTHRTPDSRVARSARDRAPLFLRLLIRPGWGGVNHVRPRGIMFSRCGGCLSCGSCIATLRVRYNFSRRADGVVDCRRWPGAPSVSLVPRAGGLCRMLGTTGAAPIRLGFMAMHMPRLGAGGGCCTKCTAWARNSQIACQQAGRARPVSLCGPSQTRSHVQICYGVACAPQRRRNSAKRRKFRALPRWGPANLYCSTGRSVASDVGPPGAAIRGARSARSRDSTRLRPRRPPPRGRARESTSGTRAG
jgi:hypothetical protein